MIKLFVAPSGSDTDGNGSIGQPFASIKAAQQRIRRSIAQNELTEDAYILLREGTYYLTQAVVIEAEDCDDHCCVHYTNYNHETVRIIGGVPFRNWSDPDENGLVSTDISAIGDFYALYRNKKRLANAKCEEWQNVSVKDPTHLQAVYGSVTSWFGEILKSKIENGEVVTDLPQSPFSHPLQCLQGAKEYICKDGDWAIENKRLYYKPQDPTTLASDEIIAGLTQSIFVLNGTHDRPVKNIVIEGLQMEMTAFGENLAAHARHNNILAEYDCNLNGMVTLKHTKNVTVRNCLMDHSGYIGVVLSGYAQYNTVSGNDIAQAGYAGIFLIGENPGSLNYCSHHNLITNNRIRDVGAYVGHGAGIYLINSGENEITHNDIANVPRYGISLKGMRYGVFADNGLSDVAFEDHWKYNQTTKNKIAYNRIGNTGIRSGDGGGIEGWGMGRENLIDHNIIYNAYRGIATENWRGHSIFLDDAAHHTTVTNNIIYDENAVSVNAGIFIKSINNYVVNNVFDVGYAKSGAADIMPYICPAGDSVFAHNIVYSAVGGTLHDDGSHLPQGKGDRIMLYFSDSSNMTGTPSLQSLRKMDQNLYFNAVGTAQFRIEDRLLTFEEWKAHPKNINRYDANSITADPLFMDAENHDYRLQTDSPALSLGIRSIETQNIGLTKDFIFSK